MAQLETTSPAPADDATGQKPDMPNETPEAPTPAEREPDDKHAAHAQDKTIAPKPLKPPKPPKTAEQLAWEKARKEHFKTYTWEPLLRPMVALLVICLVASALLGLTNTLTASIIAAENERTAEAARTALLPEADGFTPLGTQLPDGVTAIYEATNGAGTIVESAGRGYGGAVPAMVAFGPDGNILGVTFPANNETVGLGQKVTEPAFAGQFAGLPAVTLAFSDIEAIASATISSNAALNAMNVAIDAYNTLVGPGQSKEAA